MRQGLREILRHELRTIYFDPALLLVMCGGVLFYAILYPLPYQQGVPREQRVAVVDYDHSALSRRLVRMADATPQVRIAEQSSSLQSAQNLLAGGHVQGLLIIPENFQRDVYLGLPTTLSYAGDASYFLIYSTLIEGLLAAGSTLTAEAQGVRASVQGGNVLATPGLVQPVRLLAEPVFNPTADYSNYVIPAIFALILHQTLLIVLGGATVKDRQQRLSGRGGGAYYLALPLRLCGAVAGYLVLAMLYFGFFLMFYDVPRVAGSIQLLAVCLLFLLATGSLGLVLGYLLRQPEQATIVALLSAMPLLFTAGFVWPLESLPPVLDVLGWLLPAKPGILALLKVNQMGAGLAGIGHELMLLVAQFLVFGFLAGWLAMRESGREPAMAAVS